MPNGSKVASVRSSACGQATAPKEDEQGAQRWWRCGSAKVLGAQRVCAPASFTCARCVCVSGVLVSSARVVRRSRSLLTLGPLFAPCLRTVLSWKGGGDRAWGAKIFTVGPLNGPKG